MGRLFRWGLTGATCLSIIAFALSVCWWARAAAWRAVPVPTCAVVAEGFPSTHVDAVWLRDRRLPECKFDHNRLQEVLDFYEEVTGQAVRADWASLKAIGVGPDTPITWRIKDVCYGRAFADTFNSVGARYVARAGVIVVTSPAGARDERQIEAVLAAQRIDRELVKRGRVVPWPVKYPGWEWTVGLGRWSATWEGGRARVWHTVAEPSDFFQDKAYGDAAGWFFDKPADVFRARSLSLRWSSRPDYGWVYECPFWVLAVATGVLPGTRLGKVIARRWWQRRNPGLCRRCGYDLRATPERCPECGLEVVATCH